jgi:hypothetical protein
MPHLLALYVRARKPSYPIDKSRGRKWLCGRISEKAESAAEAAQIFINSANALQYSRIACRTCALFSIERGGHRKTPNYLKMHQLSFSR